MPRTRTPLVAARDDFPTYAATFDHHLRAEGKADNTIEAYGKAVSQLEAFLRVRGMPLTVANITAEHIEAFLIELRDRGLSPATRNQRYRSLQQFWRYLIDEGEVRDSPLRTLSPPAVPDNPPPLITQDEFRRLTQSCNGPGFTERRDSAIIHLFYDSGIRRAEMAGLKVTDLDQTTREALVTGKGSRLRIVRYGPTTARVIDRYLLRRVHHPYADDPALWLGQRGGLSVHGIEQLVERRGRAVGLDINPHRFRHSFASEYLAGGGNEGDLMRLAGWRSRQMVDRYGRVAADHRARRNYDGHSPVERLKRR